MTTTFPQAGLDFLRDLADNNSKEWFQANKKRYERDFKIPGRALIAAINDELESISPDHVTPPNKAVSRINRDIRFSKDKTPYHTKLWGSFMDASVPKSHGAGFYFGFDLESVGVGCGAWMFPKERLEGMRSYFAATQPEFDALLAAPSFAAYREISGDAYKRVPKPWPADHPAADLLKLKGIHTRRSFELSTITSPDFVPTIATEFAVMAPFVAYLSRGLAGPE